MKPSGLPGAASILLLLATTARAAEPKWVRLTSANFELLTPAGEKRGRDAILHFEQVHSFFLRVTGSKKTWSAPVRIIGFRSRKEYEPYRPNEVAAAFYEVIRGPELLPAEGQLVQVDCLGAVARLWIQTGDDKVAFAITEPGNVAIISKGNRNISYEFQCGPQKPQPVVVHYEMKPNPKLDTQGVLRKLEFK